MSAPPIPASAELRAQLGTLLDAAERELTAAGASARAAELHAARTRRADTAPVVVVAGEAKAGKSSLVNVLVGHPALSPVDADIATGSWVSFSYAPTELAAVALADGSAPRPIAFDEIAEWASVVENPANEKGVESVAIGLPASLLGDMTLVDTPGVGGLEQGHGALTLRALKRADAALFVHDPEQPLGQSERSFLNEAAEHIDAVVIVLTKKDRYGSEVWELKCAETGKLLADHVPRYAAAPVVGVSSLLGEEAIRLGGDAELEQDSGLPELERVLRAEVVERGATLRLANVVRLADVALKQVLRGAKELISALDGDPEIERALQEDRERLTNFAERRAEWRADLDVVLRQINLDRTDAVAHAISELQIRYDGHANAATAQGLEALPAQLLDELQAVSDRVALETAESIRHAVTELVGELEDHNSALAAALGRGFDVPDLDASLLAAPVRQDGTDLDRLRMLQTWSSGRSISGYVTTLPMFAIGGVPLLLISFAGASVFAWKTHKAYRTIAYQGNFKTWVRQQLTLAQTRLNNAFNRRMIELQRELTKAVAQFLDERQRLVEERIAHYEQGSAGDPEPRRREREEAEGRLARVEGLRAEIARALTQLRGDA